MTKARKKTQKKEVPRPVQEHPWDRIPDDGEGRMESSKAFHAFTVYRDMGAVRSLAKTVRELGKPSGYKSLLEKWSREWHWVDRVAAYDQHLDRQAQLETEEARKQMIVRQIEQAMSRQNFGISLRGVAAGKINEWTRLLKEGKLKLSTTELAKILDVAIRLEESGEKLERLCRGEPTENTEVSGVIRTTNLSDQDLLELAAEIVAKKGKILPGGESP